MPRVPVTPVGSPREQIIDDRTFTEQRDEIRELEASLAEAAREGSPLAGATNTRSASTRRAS